MKKFKPLLFLVLAGVVWLLTCSDVEPNSYNTYIPIFMERAELEKSVFMVNGTRDMEHPGKIWVKDDRIYVNEKYKGVHIIDNSNPTSPRQVGFIMAPGCLDIAIKGDVIYLDNAVDLVAFDMASGQVTERLKHYFPEPISPQGKKYYNLTDLILVGWRTFDPKKD
jgi:hypothetical protein